MTVNERDLANLTGRARLPFEVQRQGGMQRLDWVLQLANPREFVHDLAAEELYLMLRDIGEHDAYALLEYASDHQLAAIQDLDIWHGNAVQIPRWLAWVDRSMAVNTDTAVRLIANTDDDLIQLLMLGEVTVHTHDLDLDTVPDTLEIIASPDGMFIFTAPVGSDMAQRLPSLLKLMWAQDMDRMRAICQNARFELESSVSEQLLHFRNARLSELGFPSPDEALEIFRYVDPRATRRQVHERLNADDEASPRLHIPSLGAVAQDIALRGVQAPSLLARALEQLDEERRAGFGQAFTFVVNKVFMALERDLSQTEHLPEAGRRAAALTNLGLAWLSDEDADQAASILRHVWPETCFRVGHGLTMELSMQARRLRARAGAAEGLMVFGDPVDGMLHAVSRPLPMFVEGLAPGEDGDAWRPFATLQELGIVAQRMMDADTLLQFFERHLGFSPQQMLHAELDGLAEDDRQQVRLATLLRTATANASVQGQISFTPLSEDAVQRFMTQRDGWDRALTDVIGADAAPGIARFGRDCFEELQRALGAVAVHHVEARFARELFLVRTRS